MNKHLRALVIENSLSRVSEANLLFLSLSHSLKREITPEYSFVFVRRGRGLRYFTNSLLDFK